MTNAPDLTPAQIDEIYRRYINGEKPSALIEEFNLDVSPSSLFTIFPPEITSTPCSRCGSPLVRERLSRAAIQARRQARISCRDCGHVESSEWCRCESCQAMEREEGARKREEEKRQRQAKIERIHDNYANAAPLDASELASVDARALLLVLAIQPRESGDDPMLPDWLTGAYLGAAHSSRLIIPKLEGDDIRTECFDDDGWLLTAESRYVASQLNVAVGMASDFDSAALESIRPRLTTESDEGRDLIRSIWLDISTAECMDYIAGQLKYYQLPPHGIPADVGISIRLMLELVPQSAVVHAIWKSVKDAVSFKQTDGCKSPRHAINVIPRLLDKHFHHRIAGHYDGVEFSRWEQISPRSRISRLFYNNLLGIAGDPGFYICISDWLKDPLTALARKDSPEEFDRPVCPQCRGGDVRYRQTSATIQIECAAGHPVARYLRN